MFSNQYLTGSLLITSCVVFHVVALLLLTKILSILSTVIEGISSSFDFFKKIILLIVAVMYVILIHTIEIIVWALTYIRVGEFEEFSQAVYFSTITATTLGYGDITLSEPYQLLSGFEAIGGLILFGVSTAFFIKLFALFINAQDAENIR